MKFLLEYSDLNFLAQIVSPYCVKVNQEKTCTVGLSEPPTYSYAFWDLSVGFYTVDSVTHPELDS